MKRVDKNELIERFSEIHKFKYDYSLVNYLNMKTKIDVICREHSDIHLFKITPDNHLKGKGCNKCSGKIDLVDSIDKFIIKANLLHGEKWDYSKFIYDGTRKTGIIICPKHGEFRQTPNSHLSGKGCKKCYDDSLKLSLRDFIEISNVKHNNLYDYSKVNYVNNRTGVIIVCKKHGTFKQTPSVHMGGSGCKSCMIDKFRINFDDFVKRAMEVHSNEYKYFRESFVDMRIKTKIECVKHGYFYMIPDNHLSKKYSCPKCSGGSVSKVEKDWLDSLKIPEEFRQYKIGKFIVDGYNPSTRTIYEFYGDFFHGNPSIYESNDLNVLVKKKFGDLYQRTILREDLLKSLGYNIISIWESDYKLKNKKNI